MSQDQVGPGSCYWQGFQTRIVDIAHIPIEECYSGPCNVRPPLGTMKSGLKMKVVC